MKARRRFCPRRPRYVRVVVYELQRGQAGQETAVVCIRDRIRRSNDCARGRPDHKALIWALKTARSTAYIPPRAPSNPQLQEASVWPYRRATPSASTPATRKPSTPCSAAIARNPAVHQSPAPQVSASAGTAMAGRCRQVDSRDPSLWRNRSPIAPSVWISSKVAAPFPITPASSGKPLLRVLDDVRDPQGFGEQTPVRSPGGFKNDKGATLSSCRGHVQRCA